MALDVNTWRPPDSGLRGELLDAVNDEEEEDEEGELPPCGRNSVSFLSLRSTCLLFITPAEKERQRERVRTHSKTKCYAVDHSSPKQISTGIRQCFPSSKLAFSTHTHTRCLRDSESGTPTTVNILILPMDNHFEFPGCQGTHELIKCIL